MTDASDLSLVFKDLKDAARLTLGSSLRAGNVINLPANGEVMVTGDLHGDIEAFGRIVEIAALGENPQRHLVLQELVHGRDSLDGACTSCILTEMAARLIMRFPSRVHLLMGNHEMAQFTGRVVMKDGHVLNRILDETAAARYNHRKEEALAYFEGFWKSLPLAARTQNRVFMSHSTPSSRRMGEFDLGVLSRPLDEADFARGGAAYALLWGRDFSQEAAGKLTQLLDTDFIIVGHTSCPDGYSAPNGVHIVLDSQGPAGTYMLLPLEGPLTYEELIGRIRPIWS